MNNYQVIIIKTGNVTMEKLSKCYNAKGRFQKQNGKRLRFSDQARDAKKKKKQKIVEEPDKLCKKPMVLQDVGDSEKKLANSRDAENGDFEETKRNNRTNME